MTDPLAAYRACGATRAARPFACELSPLELLGHLVERRLPALLDSAENGCPDGRYSFLCADPWAILRAKNGAAWLEVFRAPGSGRCASKPERIGLGHPMKALSQIQAALLAAEPPPLGLPFAGGALGYFAYDLGRSIERLPEKTIDDLGMDDLCLGLYDWALVCDHGTDGSPIVNKGPNAPSPRWFLAATARRPLELSTEDILDEAETWLARSLRVESSPEPRHCPDAQTSSRVQRGFRPEAYIAAVRRALEHIFAGDVYQVCLTQRFDVEVNEPALALYDRLRRRTRAMFSAYLDTPTAQLLSLSPERFLRLRGREVETCPIKGTRPRGNTPEEDAAMAAELTASTKDLAELSMIVDLERNDLGRVCEAGTVRVDDHAALYTLPTVHHTVTRVAGTLRAEVDAAALLGATFPGGSITGAPKIRSMEIIEDIEPTRRGAYTGSIGYLDYSGDLDLNIAIRTVILRGKKASVQAGGGIVADSDPLAEHEEALTKALALIEALGASL
ncbi:MAG: aminodeoxychorismate synthase component I [Polyangia bacterium]|jgi:aminodeoxychorismate synthase component I|nr:aminodeoxychorismate synthase component I [Polyangia bacterium]